MTSAVQKKTRSEYAKDYGGKCRSTLPAKVHCRLTEDGRGCALRHLDRLSTSDHLLPSIIMPT